MTREVEGNELYLLCHYCNIYLTTYRFRHQSHISSGKDEADFYDDIEIIVRELLYRLNDESATVLKANQLALTALTKHVPSEELVKHIDYVRNLIASMVSDARRRKGGVGDGEFLMPGFNIPKGEFLVLLFFSWMKTGHSYVC